MDDKLLKAGQALIATLSIGLVLVMAVGLGAVIIRVAFEMVEWSLQ